MKLSRAAMDKLLRVLEITRTLRWPSHSGLFEQTVKVDQRELERWGDLERGQATQDLSLGFQLAHAYTGKLPANTEATAGISARDGLPYRLPQPGILTICKGPCTPQAEVFGRQRANVLQLGPVYYLPCRSPAFSSSSCELSYAETGELKSMGGDQTNAPGERMSTAFADAATQYAGYRSVKAGAADKARAAELADAKQELELRAAKAALDANTDVAAKTSGMKAATELVRAEIALLEAGQALRALKAQEALP